MSTCRQAGRRAGRHSTELSGSEPAKQRDPPSTRALKERLHPARPATMQQYHAVPPAIP
jgi:hypothetical protein